MTAHVTRLILEEDQYRSVSRLARSQSRSMDDVIHDLVDLGLERMKAETEEKLRTLDKLASLGRKIGPVSGDPIAEVRAEREADQARILAGEASR